MVAGVQSEDNGLGDVLGEDGWRVLGDIDGDDGCLLYDAGTADK